MSNTDFDLRRFERRLRLGRAFRFGLFGALTGCVTATVWVVLDAFGVVDATAPWVGGWIGFCLVAGAICGVLQRVPHAALARSIDRRAKLQDRLTSTMDGRSSAFSGDLREDAELRLSQVSPTEVFPIRFGRKMAGVAFSFTLPFALLFVSAHHLLMSTSAREEREALKQAAPEVQHILKPLLAEKEQSPEEAALAKELQKLQRDLEKGRLDKESALEKANQISQEADRLAREQSQKTLKSLDSAQGALDKMKKDLLASNGIDDPSLSAMNGKELSDKLQELAAHAPSAKQLSDLQKKIDDLQKKLDEKGLSEAQKKSLQQQLASLKKQMYELKLSEAVKKMLDRLQSNPEYQKLLKMMKEMQKAENSAQQGEQPPLTKEQIAQMEQNLEDLAKKLKTDKDMEDYIKQLEEALKNGTKQGNCQNVCLGLQGLMNMGGAPSTTPGPPSGAHINMSDKEEAGQGTTHEVGIQADTQRNSDEPAPYIEQKGMAKLSGPSAIPMLKDVPASRLKAEAAIDKQKIPKEHQERVKKYFEALEGR